MVVATEKLVERVVEGEVVVGEVVVGEVVVGEVVVGEVVVGEVVVVEVMIVVVVKVVVELVVVELVVVVIVGFILGGDVDGAINITNAIVAVVNNTYTNDMTKPVASDFIFVLLRIYTAVFKIILPNNSVLCLLSI